MAMASKDLKLHQYRLARAESLPKLPDPLRLEALNTVAVIRRRWQTEWRFIHRGKKSASSSQHSGKRVNRSTSQ
jgi:hypothetical protein